MPTSKKLGLLGWLYTPVFVMALLTLVFLTVETRLVLSVMAMGVFGLFSTLIIGGRFFVSIGSFITSFTLFLNSVKGNDSKELLSHISKKGAIHPNLLGMIFNPLWFLLFSIFTLLIIILSSMVGLENAFMSEHGESIHSVLHNSIAIWGVLVVMLAMILFSQLTLRVAIRTAGGNNE